MRIRPATALVAVLGLTLAACGSQVTAQTPAEEPAMNTISVTGTGQVSGTPDTLVVTLGVSVLRDTVDQATGDAAELATGVIDALEASGVAPEDIQTANYSIRPEYDYQGETQELRGYQVTNTVTAKLRDLDAAGEAIDAATAAGGDDVVVQGVSFDLEANEDLIVAARDAAWQDAEAKATQLAELAGVQLGQAVSIRETATPVTPPIPFERGLAADEAASTPIEPGQQQVSVQLQVEFAIEG